MFFRQNIYIYLESLFHVLSNYPQNILTQASGENELCSLEEDSAINHLYVIVLMNQCVNNEYIRKRMAFLNPKLLL
jgi:hypothetical protein